LLALAIWMLERILPGGLIMLLWGVLAISSGIYMGALDRLQAGVSGWRRLWKSLGIVLLVLGITEVVGAAAGGDYWLRPLSGLATTTGAGPAEEHKAFQRIKSLGDLERALELASAESRPVMLDFYADWCVECIRMERNTFPEPQVQAEFEGLDLLQADVTANDDLDQALMKAYRLVGYFEAEEFAGHLQKVLVAQ
jgi:thiol:disulfide interchange protein DsbD